MSSRLHDPVPPELAGKFGEWLASQGWTQDALVTSPMSLSWVRPVVGDLVATLVVTGPPTFRPGSTLSAHTGIGHLAASRLRPRLAAGLDQTLLPLYAPWPCAELPDSEDEADSFLDAVVQLAERAAEAAERLSVPGALEDALHKQYAENEDPIPLPLHLASTGRVEEALAVADQEIGVEGAWTSGSEMPDRRFARQLRRWAGAGAPSPPPREAWPAHAFSTHPIEVDDEDDREHGPTAGPGGQGCRGRRTPSARAAALPHAISRRGQRRGALGGRPARG